MTTVKTIQAIHQAFEKDARAVLRVVRKKFPEARIASGCPADVAGLSDIDVLVFREGAKERWIQKRMQGREVNILVTGDETRKRALAHREWELREMRVSVLNSVEATCEYKRQGLKTEEAWCKACDLTILSGDDVYTTIADAQEITPRPQLLAGVQEYSFY